MLAEDWGPPQFEYHRLNRLTLPSLGSSILLVHTSQFYNFYWLQVDNEDG